MFHRSSRSQSRSAPIATRNNVNPNANASATAHSAAAQAFLASTRSTPNLSSAAAAAALRSMSPAPTNVAATQTKRTLQRQLSNSSVGSGGRGRGSLSRPGLQRSGSSGSMTERTFRSPSPGRPVSRTGREPAPPVPAIRDEYADVPPVPARSHRRVASMDPVPRRVLSPPATKGVGRGQSLDRGPAPAKVPVQTPISPSQRAALMAAAPKSTPPRSSNMEKINELERSDSQSSINFSYPRGARPNSPTPRSPVMKPGEHQFPMTMRSGTVPSNAVGIAYDVARAAEQPVKKKKKFVAKGATEGSHFQNAGMGGKPIVHPLEPLHAITESPDPPLVKKKKKKTVVSEENAQFHDSVSSQDGSDYDSSQEKPIERRAQRASGVLTKQPSIVREDWEGEQAGEKRLDSPIQTQGDPSSSFVQSKRVSTAANVSKKIDEASSPQRQSSQQTIHDSVTLPSSPGQQAENRKHLAVAGSDLQHTRTASLSPSRSFRFSDNLSSDLAAGQKHEPLPRSVSPAKSAMRPTANGQLSSTLRNSSQTPSEASDNNSLISADGLGPSVRRKKSARVSFDPEPEVVGVSAAQNELDSSPPSSPQTKDSGKKGWFGLGKSKTSGLGTIQAEDDMEEVMAPRPALPFFGSVRNKPRGTEQFDNPPGRQTQTAPAPATSILSHNTTNIPSSPSGTSSSSLTLTPNTSASSDHAIGNLLAQESFRTKLPSPAVQQPHNLPLPPEVTSVEGTGYASDTDSDVEVEAPRSSVIPPHPSQPRTSTQAAVVPVAAASAVETVPVIAVHPATPGLEQSETKGQDQWLVQVPGGFPSSSTEQLSSFQPEVNKDVAPASPAGLGITEPAPKNVPGKVSDEDPQVNQLSHALLDQHNGESNDRDSDADSIYSDAAESPAEFEGDGFGSINAIVESPLVLPPVNRSGTIPESPLSQSVSQNRPEGGNRTSSWDEAQAHWSGVAERYRQGVEETPPKQAQAVAVPSQEVKSKPKKTSRAPGVIAAAAAAAPASQKYVDYSPPSTPPPKLQDASARQAARLKNRQSDPVSNRQATSTSNRQSMPAQPTLAPALSPRSQPLPSSAPVAAPAPAPRQRGALQKRNIPAAVAGQRSMRPTSPGSTAPTNTTSLRGQPLQRTFSNDSDSESSFRKRRRAKAENGGVYSMRRSMRANQAPEPVPDPVARRGVRSLSPLNRRPFSPVGGQKPMRSSMRENGNTGAPTLRTQPSPQRSSSLFGRSKKAQSPPPSAPLQIGSKFKSRFAGGSDDEDDPAPKSFRSRFEDSSDEEPEPEKFRPVRGIPRKADEAESTDLEDSSDEEKKVPQQKALPTINPQQPNNLLPDVPQSPVSPSSEKKRSFFGRFRSKKDKDVNSKAKLGVGQIAERDSIVEKTKADGQAAQDLADLSSAKKNATEDKNRASRLGFGTIAERDAMIERTRQQLEERRDSVDQGLPNGATSNGGLKQRATPQRIMSDSWPLPPKMLIAPDNRPNTSDGVGLGANADVDARPGLNGGEITSDTLKSEGKAIYGRSGKKKRFPMLRRVFGLTD